MRRVAILAVAATLGGTAACRASAADPSRSAAIRGGAVIPADRLTVWNPGIPGGVPVRTEACATLRASDHGNGRADASKAINAAIARCPHGKVVQLSPGDFRIESEIVTLGKSGVVLRGAGAGVTRLIRTNGARPGTYIGRAHMPVILIGSARWPRFEEGTARKLIVDGTKGASSVRVTDASPFSAGQLVLLDEETKGAWATLPHRSGAPTQTRIWKGDRVAWALHDPREPQDDPLVVGRGGKLGTGSDAASWFSRQDRPISEVKEIASVDRGTITFTTPLHISYRASHEAQVVGFAQETVRDAGIEGFTVQGGDDGNVRFENVARCWARGIESTGWLGEGVAIDRSFRVEVRDSYVHDGVWPEPGGGGYAISLSTGSSEALVENSIAINVNKVIVARAAGAGSVIGYNYMDNALIYSHPGWVEVGLNGSHMVGPHHMLFEGNASFNADSDFTHGSAIHHTFFRNHLSGARRGGRVMPEGPLGARTLRDEGNVRCVGLAYGSYWMNFVGNVLGLPGRMGGWVHENVGDGRHGWSRGNPWGRSKSVWTLGYDPVHWEQSGDPQVTATLLREGNFDYLGGIVHWTSGPKHIPDSLYLRRKPEFFGANPWPWVDAVGATKLHTLPAKARFDAGTPNGVGAHASRRLDP